MTQRSAAIGAAAVALVLAAPVPQAQAPSPAFEVSSVKVNKDGGPSSVKVTPGGMLTITNNTLRNIIRNAWNITNDQIVGGPDWIDSERFDITAKAAKPFGQDEARAMLQALLADRFGLATRNETRELPVYLLVLARKDGALGPQMKKSGLDCGAILAAVTAGGKMPERLPNGNLPCSITVRTNQGQGLVTGNGVAMEALARNLVGGVGRIVVDRTGLQGYYDINVKFAADGPPPPPGGPETPPADPSAPSLFTAMQEQLGLKLDPGKAPIAVLVIDRVQRPTAD